MAAANLRTRGSERGDVVSDNICIHHTDAERDAWRIGCPICLSKQLAAVTADRDRLRDTKWQGITKLESDLATSQQEAWRLREALEIVRCDADAVGNDWLSVQQEGIQSIIRNIREKSAVALSSTPASVQK